MGTCLAGRLHGMAGDGPTLDDADVAGPGDGWHIVTMDLALQITSNVWLNNLSQLERHPLRQYLAAGVPCVQGTDGGAIYGTDSIDEQLALEKTLNLSKEELVAMRRAEDAVRSRGLAALEDEMRAFVPARIGAKEAEALSRADVRIRVAVEPSPMGVYKSVAYEVFKRRPSVLVGLDGNSSGANMIQDAKNGKRRCRMFVLDRRGMLREKARNLEGYVSLFRVGDDLAGAVCGAVETCYPEKWLRQLSS